MLLDITTWWEALSTPERWFWGIGLISNALFFLYLLLHIMGHQLDADIEGDLDFSDGDLDFAILSVRSILAFGMFLGYTGIVVLKSGGSWLFALAAGAMAGYMAAWLAYRFIRLMLRMQSSGTLDMRNAIGQTGTVHLTIPAHKTGIGKVMVEVQGGLREMDAIAEEDEIANGSTVLVLAITDTGTLLVQTFDIKP